MTAGNLTHSRRAAAPPCAPRRGEPNRPNSGSKSPAHTSARRANGKQTPAAQARPSAEAAGCPQAGDKTAAHRQKNAGTPGTKAAATAAGRAKTTSPAHGAACRTKKSLRTGKTRVRSFACPEGPCKTGPPKIRFAVFGWHGLFLLRVSDFTAHCACFAARSAAPKGALPPFIPRKLFEKSLSKNFHEGPGAPRP